MNITHYDHFHMVAAALIGILSVARTARLVAHDVLPPLPRIRAWWTLHAPRGTTPLLTCHFCLTPWMATGMALWFYLADGHWTWWVINGVWGLSYVAAAFVSYDQPPGP